MIIRQTTTIVFEYPQDYLQEQEWCKTKEDRWIHKSTDTLGAVYENTISYSIGQPNSSENPNNSTISKMEQVETLSCQECKRWIYDDRWGWFCPLKSQDECKYEPKDLEQFRVGLEYHTDTTHFGKVKGESITTNKVEDEQTDCTEALTLLWIKNMVTDEEFYRIDARLKVMPQTERSE